MYRAIREAPRFVAALLVLATPLDAQTVRPAVVEYAGPGRGRFELVNESLYPLTVVLELHGFRVEESGELIQVPLDTSAIRVSLSAMSFRIPPRGTYVVSYEATARQYPAWFQISSALSGARTSSGLNVRVELPHVVYLLQKQPLRRDDVVVRDFVLDTVARMARVTVENTGAALGRVLETEIRGASGSPAVGGAFPLFPHSRRRFEVPWAGAETPERVQLRFAGFTLEERRKPTS
jgi:hypothetical protein